MEYQCTVLAVAFHQAPRVSRSFPLWDIVECSTNSCPELIYRQDYQRTTNGHKSILRLTEIRHHTQTRLQLV
jgi:hypothetical protein